jgi:hypothetical protein
MEEMCNLIGSVARETVHPWEILTKRAGRRVLGTIDQSSQSFMWHN